jgi:hypothetical protein
MFEVRWRGVFSSPAMKTFPRPDGVDALLLKMLTRSLESMGDPQPL